VSALRAGWIVGIDGDELPRRGEANRSSPSADSTALMKRGAAGQTNAESSRSSLRFRRRRELPVVPHDRETD